MANFQMPVTEYMSCPVQAINLGTTLVEANDILAKEQISALPVLDAGGAPKGVISRTDMLHAMIYETGEPVRLPARPVEELMQSPAVTVTAEDSVATAARTMAKSRLHRVFVTEDDVIVGVLSTRDLMQAIREARIKTPISEIGSGSIVKVKATDPVALAVDRLDRSNKHGMVVVDGDFTVGTFDQACAMEARRLGSDATVEDAMNIRFLVLPPRMPIGRAAAQAIGMHVRRILLEDDRGVFGIVSGLDFARAIA